MYAPTSSIQFVIWNGSTIPVIRKGNRLVWYEIPSNWHTKSGTTLVINGAVNSSLSGTTLTIS